MKTQKIKVDDEMASFLQLDNGENIVNATGGDYTLREIVKQAWCKGYESCQKDLTSQS